MYLKSIELVGFKSFAKKTSLDFNSPITSIVGPNGSGKSNVAEAFRFVLGEQSIKSLRGKRGEDLIFNGSRTIGRQNRASVKVVFDNSTKFLNIDFDEVTIERVVHRDNRNDYLVNGSAVRLKDIIELLAGAHIGSSGHHIISQGEADRMLNANLDERRVMIEDALGLKIYQYKRQESERKLEKTGENIEQVESLRREIAPHLKFLRKQVEKVEKVRELRDDLARMYRQYFKREKIYLDAERSKIDAEAKVPKENLARLEKELRDAKIALESSEKSDFGKKVIDFESRLSEARKHRENLLREVGRLEGEIGGEKRRLDRLESMSGSGESRLVTFSEAKELSERIEMGLGEAERERDVPKLKAIFFGIRETVRVFLRRFETQGGETESELRAELKRLEEEKKGIEKSVEEALLGEKGLEGEYNAIKQKIDENKDVGRKAEREIFRIMQMENEERSKLSHLKDLEEKLRFEEADMKSELSEALALSGDEAVAYEETRVVDDSGCEADREGVLHEPRSAQHDRRKHIERLKIKLEELGGGSSEEIVKEFKEVEERDLFLEREIIDLKKSAESLETLIRELSDRLDYEFREGVKRINAKFSEFFMAMFGGGHAELIIVKEKKGRSSDEDSDFLGVVSDMQEEENEEGREGININVSLPHKKIKGLEMLSGGERALTSIALLFAISQVNPPPFIILDETDAALDEANSKKYGNMIEDLAKYSQLVLVTHNRETMSRAGVLYGVTMGQDGVSRLLSIKFDEAVKVAK